MTIKKLSLGSVQWGSFYGISNNSGQTDTNEVSRILDKAYFEGIKIIDTASTYGTAESVLGKHNLSLFSLLTKIPKFKTNIITKLDSEDMIFKFNQSLKKLNLKSCYGLLLHQKEDIFKKGNEYIIQGLNDLKLKGLVKKIGVSIYDSDKIDKVVERLKPDIIQLPLNVLDQRVLQNGTLNYLKSNDIEIHARSIFLQGLLLMQTENIPLYFKKWSKKLNDWKKICEKENVNFLEAALSFVIKQKNIDYCTIGVENLEQLNQCISASKSSHEVDLSELACEDVNLLNPFNWK